MIPGPHPDLVTQRLAPQLFGLDIDGREELGAGRFSQQTQTAMIGLIVARGRPKIVHRIHHDALAAGRGEIEGNAHAETVAGLRDGRVDVGIDGVHPRRHEHASGGGAHLMHIVDDLRMPGVVHLLDGETRFSLRKDIPIAVVVVADILLI